MLAAIEENVEKHMHICFHSVFCSYLSSGDIARLNAAFRRAVVGALLIACMIFQISLIIHKVDFFKQIVSHIDYCLHHL